MSGANFPALKEGEYYPIEAMPLRPYELPLPPSYASSRNPSLSNLKSLRCCVPPPDTFTDDLIALQPHLERDPADKNSESPVFIPIKIDLLQFDTTMDDYSCFGRIARLFNPVEYVLRSLEPWSQCWRVGGCVPRPSWLSLTSIVFDNCLPLRPDQGDMPESFALPYMCHPLLQFVTVIVTKWDATEDGIIEGVGWEVPLNRYGKNGEWPKFERLLVKVTGRKRLERGQKKVEKVIGWEGEEMKKNVEAKLRWELLKGEVPPMPEDWEGEEEEDGEVDEHDEWRRELKLPLPSQDQYLPLLSSAYFAPKGPSKHLPKDLLLQPFQLPLPPSYANTRNPSLCYLKSLTCLVPPPPEFRSALTALQPHLERDAYRGPGKEDFPTFVPLRLEQLELSTTKDGYGGYKALAWLVNPVEFVLHSLELWSQCWREDVCVPSGCWTALTSITFDNCLPLRSDQGDMPEAFALPYMCHPLLEHVTVSISKWDAPEDGMVEGVGWEVPLNRDGNHGEWPKFKRLLVKIVGKERLERAKQTVAEMVKFDEEETGEDETRRNVEKRLRWELLPGEIPLRPDEWEGDDEESYEDSDEYSEEDSDGEEDSEEDSEEEAEEVDPGEFVDLEEY
ncbi:hypothetical protein P7C70_g1527, partial [Phenoliferia sp. Uapishka_3]